MLFYHFISYYTTTILTAAMLATIDFTLTSMLLLLRFHKLMLTLLEPGFKLE